ncbi:type I repeat containing protein [Babesia ovis]|uniref:Type I repeat containing protein n=1 Tax=Babesia ovis TaxID=5869 RepID=A0A9W5TEP6_BABOV|nr:type I repeat containing protein [Babesia ovis]
MQLYTVILSVTIVILRPLWRIVGIGIIDGNSAPVTPSTSTWSKPSVRIFRNPFERARSQHKDIDSFLTRVSVPGERGADIIKKAMQQEQFESVKKEDGNEPKGNKKIAPLDIRDLTSNDEIRTVSNFIGIANAECPPGHVIAFLDAVANCAGTPRYFTVSIWDTCPYHTNCKFKLNRIGGCWSKWRLNKLKYVCIRVHDFDCILFYAKVPANRNFCLNTCMHFSKQCTNATLPISRKKRLRCIATSFKTNAFDQRCSFLFERLNKVDVRYTETYFDPKHEIGEVELTNGVWTNVKFTNPIESPVVFTSVPQSSSNPVHVDISDVSRTGFWATTYVLHCTPSCIFLSSPIKHTVQWIALSKGDHSPKPNGIIRSGIITSNVSKKVKLPLDPSRHWIVILQTQGTTMDLENIRYQRKTMLIIPALMKYRGIYRVNFAFTGNSRTDDKQVKLGYLAIEKKSDIKFHGLKLMTFVEESDMLGVAKVSIDLPYTWPNPKHIFGYVTVPVLNIPDDEDQAPIGVPRLKVFQDAPAVNTDAITYEFTTEMTVVPIMPTYRLHLANVYGFFIQDEGYAMAEEICNFAKKKGHRNISTTCYDYCINANGIRKCAHDDDLVICFQRKHPECVIDAPGLEHKIKKYVKYIRKKYPEDATPVKDYNLYIPEENTDNAPKVDEPEQKEEEKPEVVEVEAVDLIIERDCIPGPWGEWSACSNKCTSDKLTTVQVRRRPVYAPKAGLNTLSCQLTETRECTGLPQCSEFCYSREGAGEPQVFQQKYYYIWSEKCEDPNVAHDNELEPFQFIAGTQHESEVVTRMGINHNMMGLQEALNNLGNNSANSYDPRYTDPNNWSGCNAPCKLDKNNTETEYLRVPLTGYDHRRPCKQKLKNCPPKEIEEHSDEHHGCVLKYAFYDPALKTWTKDGACLCEGGYACTAEEIHVHGNTSELVSTDNDGYLEHLVRATPYQLHISLANYNRIELPTDVVRDVAYGTFKQGELGNYCATGNIEVREFSDDIMWIDCRLAVSSDYRNQSGCQDRCQLIRAACEEEIQQPTVAEIGKCVDNRIRYATTNIFVLNFKFNNCSDPMTNALTEAEICDIMERNIKRTRQCSMLCRRLVNMCKTLLDHSRERVIRHCMLRHIQKNDIVMYDRKPVNFQDLCVFKHTKIMGSGLVYCKKHKLVCEAGPWGPWKPCPASCIYMKDGKFDVPYRVRTRQLKVSTYDEKIRCIRKGVVSMEKVPCLWLPQCPDDPTIRQEMEAQQFHLVWETPIESTWDLQGWVLNDSRQGESSLDQHCTIYSGQRDVSKNNIIYQKSSCSCPTNTVPCSVLESVHSSGWFDMLQLMCHEDEMRSVLFNQSTAFYRYSCLTRSFVRQDFDAHNELCNEDGNTSFRTLHHRQQLSPFLEYAAGWTPILTSFMLLGSSVVYIGRRGAILGAVGGLTVGLTLGVIHSGSTSAIIIEGILCMFAGVTIGFIPLFPTLKINSRYIDQGLRAAALSS